VIEFIFEQIEPVQISERSIIKWIETIVNIEDTVVGDICYIFSNDEYILEINRKYLKHDYYTDIITFDYSSKPIISGDIFISIDRVKENSEHYNVSFDYELLRILIHGILHLLGYKDKTDDEKMLMTSKEEECLKLFKDVEGI